MKTIILLVGISGTPAFGQGYICFSWLDAPNYNDGIQIGWSSGVCGQLPGYYLASDYSVEAWMAAGGSQPQWSLIPIPSTKTTFIGDATTTAYGGPLTDGSGLWYEGPVDTGLPVGLATIQVRAWYDPNHNLTYEQSEFLGYNFGSSALYNINLVSSTDPNMQYLESVGFQKFTVGNWPPITCTPEPSTFMLGCLGFGALLIFARKKSST
jgi:hypothetical protein